MQIFIQVENGVPVAAVAEESNDSGKRVLVRIGSEVDGKFVLDNPPQHLLDTVNWALTRLNSAKVEELKRTLVEYGGVDKDKIQEALDAIEATKGK